MVTDLKEELHRKLRAARATLLSKLDGLSEYDMRRPMTHTGTNMLGLVKHLAGVEYELLGASLKRPAPETLAWIEDGSIWEGADMWATPEESSQYLIGLYERACAHGDETIADLDLQAPGWVAHWAEGKRYNARRLAHSDGRRDCPARGARGYHPRAHRRAGWARS
jgi:hypothetical protein